MRQAAPADREPENRTLEQLMRTADRKGGTIVPDHHIPVLQQDIQKISPFHT